MKLTYRILDIMRHTPLARIMRKLPFAKTEKQPWNGDMVAESCGLGKRVKYPGYMSATEKLRWVSREKTAEGGPVAVREPQEQTYTFPDNDFYAAGKHYSNIGQLFVKMGGERAAWCRDVYGREVLYLIERFPCFDFYDAMNENRCYRWFFLREGMRLTRVFFVDGGWEVYVTEDLENIECGRWEDMQELNYFDWN